jgi:hypothetical protein
MPQPSSDQLLADAELAGLARVIMVKHTPAGRVARLRFEQVLKGTFQGSFATRHWRRLGGAVTVKLHKAHHAAGEERVQGEWSDRVAPGDRIMIHLRWDPDTATYSTIAPNAIWLAPG